MLVNGVPEEPFRTERVFRRGDLLLVYIYICIYIVDYLGRYIQFMANVMKPRVSIKIFNNSPVIPYMMFADDCMISCNANRKAARHAKEILENGCTTSG